MLCSRNINNIKGLLSICNWICWMESHITVTVTCPWASVLKDIFTLEKDIFITLGVGLWHLVWTFESDFIPHCVCLLFISRARFQRLSTITTEPSISLLITHSYRKTLENWKILNIPTLLSPGEPPLRAAIILMSPADD